ELAAGGGAVQLLRRLRERGQLHPLPRRLGVDRAEGQRGRQQQGERQPSSHRAPLSPASRGTSVGGLSAARPFAASESITEPLARAPGPRSTGGAARRRGAAAGRPASRSPAPAGPPRSGAGRRRGGPRGRRSATAGGRPPAAGPGSSPAPAAPA